MPVVPQYVSDLDGTVLDPADAKVLRIQVGVSSTPASPGNGLTVSEELVMTTAQQAAALLLIEDFRTETEARWQTLKAAILAL